jgi:hypothetical protein
MITSDRATQYTIWYRRSISDDPLRVTMFNLCASACEAACLSATATPAVALEWMHGGVGTITQEDCPYG